MDTMSVKNIYLPKVLDKKKLGQIKNKGK